LIISDGRCGDKVTFLDFEIVDPLDQIIELLIVRFVRFVFTPPLDLRFGECGISHHPVTEGVPDEFFVYCLFTDKEAKGLEEIQHNLEIVRLVTGLKSYGGGASSFLQSWLIEPVLKLQKETNTQGCARMLELELRDHSDD